MSDDIRQKVIVSVSVENSAGAQRAIQEVQKKLVELDKAAKEAKPDIEKALAAIGLGAEAQLGPLSRLHSAFQGFTGKIGQGIGAIDGFAKSLGPWNQALELGGKAIKFATEGLDAYAKTSPQAAAEVKALKDEFGHLKDTAMAAFGEITVAVLKPLPSIEELKRKLEGLDESFARSAFLGGFAKGKENGSFFRGDDETKDPLGALSRSFQGFNKTLAGTVDHWNTDGQSFVDSIEAGFKKSADAAKKAATETARWRAELAALASKNAKEQTDKVIEDLQRQLAFDQRSVLGDNDLTNRVDFDAAKASIAQASAGLPAFKDSLQEVIAVLTSFNQQGPLLDRLGIPRPEEWDSAAFAARAFNDALGPSLEALATSSMSAGQIFKKGIGMIVHALGDKLAAHASAEFIEAGAHAILLDFPGAARHAGAGALYAGGAVAAYATAAKLGGSGGSAPSGAQASGSGGSVSGGGADNHDHRTGQTDSGGSARPIVLIVGDHFAEMSNRQRRLEAEDTMKRALRERDGD